MTKEELLKSLEANNNSASAVVRRQFAHEIIAGRQLRDQYAQYTDQPSEQVIRQEMTPTISYVALRNGQVADYEPPIEPMGTSRADMDLARYPIYKALLESLSK